MRVGWSSVRAAGYSIKRVIINVHVTVDLIWDHFVTAAPGTAVYRTVSLLSSRALSQNMKIKIYRTVILPVVLYGCETDIAGGKEAEGV